MFVPDISFEPKAMYPKTPSVKYTAEQILIAFLVTIHILSNDAIGHDSKISNSWLEVTKKNYLI